MVVVYHQHPFLKMFVSDLAIATWPTEIWKKVGLFSFFVTLNLTPLCCLYKQCHAPSNSLHYCYNVPNSHNFGTVLHVQDRYESHLLIDAKSIPVTFNLMSHFNGVRVTKKCISLFSL